MSADDEVVQSDQRCLEDALKVLRRHYEYAQIFVQRADASHHMSMGNPDALYGQIKRWTIQEEEVMRRSDGPFRAEEDDE